MYKNQRIIQQVFLTFFLCLWCSIYILQVAVLKELKIHFETESNKLIKEYVIKNKVVGARCINAVGFQSREKGRIHVRQVRAS